MSDPTTPNGNSPTPDRNGPTPERKKAHPERDGTPPERKGTPRDRSGSAADRSGSAADRSGSSADRSGSSADRSDTTVRRRGRPPRAESGDTRDRILAVAREEFSERGYDKTSVRGIAKAAGVDSALVHHYFGTKEQVFEAVALTLDPALNMPVGLADGPLEGAGERLTRFLFGLWENPVYRAPLLAVVRSAVNNETAAEVFRRLIVAQVLSRVAGQLDAPDAQLRAELAAAQLVGCAMLRYVIKMEPLASADTEQVIARLAPVVQGHLTGP